MDFLLMYNHPRDRQRIVSYDIIEVKHDEFDEKALTKLIDYESWFLQKKVGGDSNMVRATAIARRYSDEVIQYVKQRERIENKPIKLLKYEYTEGVFQLQMVNER